MRNIIIGTAGHIDHGKTTLIKALTGRNTDKLQEEIKRGISINLGFTYFDLPGGDRAGIIDVPGHERFIKNMLAGATGIDVVLLTVAANEGVKPQTVEHVDILNYLDIKERIVVLTKCALADAELIELAKEDVREQLAETKFRDAPIIEVDSLSGMGLDALIAEIDRAAHSVRTRNEKAAARLNVDRAFSIKGFGLVVTGTLCEGNISVGDELMLYPKGLRAKIRNVQVHDENVQTAYAGQRTALNVSSLSAADIERGDVLAKPGSLAETTLLDVRLGLVPHTERTFKLWDRLRLYLGTKDVLARIVPLSCDLVTAESGDCYCQLRLEEPVAAKKDDRFVIRFYSPMETVGGGVVLDPNPARHGKADARALEALKIRDTGDILDVVDDFLRSCAEKYTPAEAVAEYISKDWQTAGELIAELIGRGIVLEINGFLFHRDTVEGLRLNTLELLSKYHNTYKLRRGMAKEELKSKLKTTLKPKEFDYLLRLFQDEGYIRLTDKLVALKEFEVIYGKRQLEIKNEIEEILVAKQFMPPSIDELCKTKEYAEVLESLDSIVIIDAQLALHQSLYSQALAQLKAHLSAHGEITLAEFRDLTGSSRKYAMAILEYFDRNDITARVGDKRVAGRNIPG